MLVAGAIPTTNLGENTPNGASVFAYRVLDFTNSFWTTVAPNSVGWSSPNPRWQIDTDLPRNAHLKTAAVSVVSSPDGCGTLTRYPQNAAMREVVTLTQSANTGFIFINWTSATAVTFDQANHTFRMLDAAIAPITVTANYDAHTLTV